ncbi:MAG: DEAD/DEAH box helicase [Deltaproteobacteria bacterium]|nr:DEAD/DEAH box helicase [Deltaproteobacteria bacterium]
MQQFVKFLKTAELPGARLAHYQFLPRRTARYGSLRQPLAPQLQNGLAQLGIRRLYQHQVEALDLCRQGKNVVVATPTATGKSLIYNLALFELLTGQERGHGLYLFPLKALAQDQLQAFLSVNQTLPEEMQLRAAIYDGDTAPTERRRIKKQMPDLIISNPDMLHLALLPFHQQWEKFFRRLKLVVLDEVHTYRGIFGSHITQIFRRLQRVCRLYGSRPQFILLSATIANAAQFAATLTGLPFAAVDANGAPQAGRHFFFVNPELSATTVAGRLFVHALRRGLKTIAFTQARKTTEILHMTVSQTAPEFSSRVSSYRAGFLAEERRHIEQGLASGQVAGVISTSALEMGIDIGGLDVCILVGYPGTIINTWQRSGRVGRGGRDSVVILVAQADALDQYFMRYPDDFFRRSFETAVVDPDNQQVVEAHLPCAAAELPMRLDTDLYGDNGPLRQCLTRLEKQGKLLRSAAGDEWYAASRRPHRMVDIRTVGKGYTIIQEPEKEVVGKNDGVRVFKECHPGAVYLHRGQQYLVTRLDLKRCNVLVKPTNVRYYTRALSSKDTRILAVERSRPVGNFLARFGRLRVTEQVVEYEKRSLYSGELLAREPLELPPQSFETMGFWLEIEDLVQEMIRRRNFHFMGGIHALEHALISMFPLFALCDRNDIGGIAIPLHPQLHKSAVFVYDGTPGGVGLAARGFDMIEELLRKTSDLVASCPCDSGCPSCIHSPKCGSGNKPLDKQATILLSRILLDELPLHSEVGEETEVDLQIQASESQEVAASEPAIACLDLETQRLADEVGGWGNIHLMRLAVAVLYDQRAERFEVFDEQRVEQLIERLSQFDLLVGFNIKRFDFRVLGAYTSFDLQQLPTFDILEDIYQRLGFRIALGHLAEQTLGQPKSADGIQAVRWFQQGNLQALISYCQEDVRITWRLFEFGLQNGYLLYTTRQGKAVRLPLDWQLETIIRQAQNSRGGAVSSQSR